MKKTFITKMIALTAALVLAVTALASCNAAPKETAYKVNVKNALGNAYSDGIIVKFMQNGEQIAMQACDKDGVCEKTLPTGEYDVELSFTKGEDAYYYEKGTKLTAEKAENDVLVALRTEGEPASIFAGGEDRNAYNVTTGCTYVELEKGKISYFLFTPTESGNFEFSIASGADCSIGYYGAPHFVQTANVAEMKDGKFNMSIKDNMISTGDGGTTVLVLGVTSEKDAESCVIAINRIGDPVKTIEDEPWTIYEATHEMSEYKLPAGYSLKEFDLTAATDKYNLVLNEKDGFYHLDTADGPLVLVRLGEDCPKIACFKTMLDRSGVTKYFYNDKGEFEKKESYSECLLEYIEFIDEGEGVYPLTEDLKYIIQQRGDHTGWWDIESGGYIFRDADGNPDSTINPDIAWLLMCCYLG